MSGKQVQNNIEELAQEILQKYGIKTPILNIASVVRKLGGQVQETIWDNGVCRNDDSFVIFVSQWQNPSLLNWKVAQCLGHLFLHMGYRTDSKRWIKQRDRKLYQAADLDKILQANQFASAFLMPKETYQAALERYTEGSVVHMDKIAEYFGVLASAAQTRGEDLGLLDKE